MKTNQCKGVSSAYPTLKAATQVSQLPIFMFFALTLFFFSCKKELQVTNYGTLISMQLKESEELIFVKDGVLCFIDFQTMDDYLKTLLEMPDSIKLIQEAAFGFKSYATIIDSITEYIVLAASESQMAQRINANSNFVHVKDSTLVSNLPKSSHIYLADINGIFKADSTYYRIFDQGIVAWRGATLIQMKNLILDEENSEFDDDSSDGKYYFLRNETIDPLESNCGNKHINIKNTTSNWYRVHFTIRVNRRNSSSTCLANGQNISHSEYVLFVELEGFVKRFWLWHSYNSLLEFKDVYCQLTVPRQGNYNQSNCSYIPYYEYGGVANKSSSLKARYLVREFTGNLNGMGDMTHNYNHLPDPVFIKVKGKGKSAAFNANDWSEINCGY